MSKREFYPKYGENPARKALCKLQFADALTVADTGTSANDQSKIEETLQREAQRVATNLIEAMKSIYKNNYKDWVNSFWHSSLRPNLLVNITPSLREPVYASFHDAVNAECQQNRSEILAFIDELHITDCMNDGPAFAIVAKLLSYATNFETRTKQRVQAVFVLDKSYKSEVNERGMAEYASRKFGETVLDAEITRVLGEELETSISHSINAIHSSSTQVSPQQFFRDLAYPALLSIAFRDFCGSVSVNGVDPLAIVIRVLLTALKSNTPLSTHFSLNELKALTLTALERGQSVSNYIREETVDPVLHWLSRLKKWKYFISRSIDLVYELAGFVGNTKGTLIVAETVSKDLDLNSDALTEIFAICAIFAGVTGDGDTPSEPFGFLSISDEFAQKLFNSLYTKTLGSGVGRRAHGTDGAISNRLIVLNKSILSLKRMLDAQAFQKLQSHQKDMIHSYPVFASLLYDIVSGHAEISDSDKFISLIHSETNFQNPSKKSDAHTDWEETQYTNFVEEVATDLLPVSIGGLGIDPARVSEAYASISKETGDLFGILPSLLIAEMAGSTHDASATLLNYGNWLCTEDPTLALEIPATHKNYFEITHVAKAIDKNLGIKWHLGWSVLRCTLKTKNRTTNFTCSLPQFELIKKLISSQHPLQYKELIDAVGCDEEYFDQLLADLIQNSKGLVRSCEHNSTKYFAIDPNSTPMEYMARPRFSDKL